MLTAHTNAGESAQMTLASSFTMSEQVRRLSGTFAPKGSNAAAYGFVANFDQKGSDLVTIADLRAKQVILDQSLKCDKLLDLTRAFVQMARGEKDDPRLASVEWTGFFVELMDAIQKSAAELGKRESVYYGGRSFRRFLTGT